MTITLMDDTEADATGLGAIAGSDAAIVGKRVFVRNGDTIFFPGVVTAAANDNGTRNKLTVEPGLAEIPSKFQAVVDSETQTIGTIVTEAEISPKILIKQIIVKRRKLVSYEG